MNTFILNNIIISKCMVSKEDAFKAIRDGEAILFLGSGATADHSGMENTGRNIPSLLK
jgi:hypothetical protein